jgi:hypothetical protein
VHSESLASAKGNLASETSFGNPDNFARASVFACLVFGMYNRNFTFLQDIILLEDTSTAICPSTRQPQTLTAIPPVAGRSRFQTGRDLLGRTTNFFQDLYNPGDEYLALEELMDMEGDMEGDMEEDIRFTEQAADPI